MLRLSVATLAATLLIITGAEAHPRLIGATPAPNAVVAAPARLELHFSEKLVRAFSSMDVSMTSMPGMKMGSPMKMAVTTMMSPDGMTLIGVPDKRLPAGGYRLDYHVVSADTHRIHAGYDFSVR